MRVEGAQPTTVSEADQRQQRKLKEACQDFEAIFLSQILKSMRKTVSKTDLFGKGTDEETFQEMMDSELCRSVARTQSVGIADVLYRQLSAQMKNESQSDSGEMRGKADDSAKRSG